tara:strand:+ start:501 stop:821 length:321 start_codon:yes stop_codon:yes gene_type:complete
MVLIADLCELFRELREFACLDLFFADWIFAIEGDDEDIFALCQHQFIYFLKFHIEIFLSINGGGGGYRTRVHLSIPSGSTCLGSSFKFLSKSPMSRIDSKYSVKAF